MKTKINCFKRVPQRQVFVWEAVLGNCTGREKVVCPTTTSIQPQWQLRQFVTCLEAAVWGISYLAANKWLHYDSLQYSIFKQSWVFGAAGVELNTDERSCCVI